CTFNIYVLSDSARSSWKNMLAAPADTSTADRFGAARAAVASVLAVRPMASRTTSPARTSPATSAALPATAHRVRFRRLHVNQHPRQHPNFRHQQQHGGRHHNKRSLIVDDLGDVGISVVLENPNQ